MTNNGSAAKSIRAFFNGKWYPLAVVFLVFLGHTVREDLIGIAAVIGTAVIGCLFARDFRFAITPFLCTIFLVTPAHSPEAPDYSHYYIQPLPLAVLITVFTLLIAGVIVFAIRNRFRAHSIRSKGLLPGLIALCAVLLINGAFNPAYSVGNLLYALSFPAILIGFYLLFSCYIHFDESSFDYFMYCLMLAGLLISAEILTAYLDGTVRFENGSVVKESVVLGWGVWTTAGGMQAMLIPPCFYFAATRKQGWLFCFLGILEFFCTFLSMSRGGLLVGAGTLGLCLLAVCVAGKNRKQNRIFTSIVIVAGLIGLLIFREKILSVADRLINSGLGDNGRFERWRTGLDKFLGHPVFGAGFFDNGIVTDWGIVLYPCFYHNTVVQMLASCGAVGILAYAWHRFDSVRLCLRRPSLYKSFLGISILSLLMFCMLDVLFFITYPLIFYVLILVFLERADLRQISF